jgi:hypothetical protein
MGATIEKRVNITPSPATGPLLRELAKLTGKPVSTIVRELLDEMSPAMPQMIEAMKIMKTRPDEAQAALARMAAGLHHDLAQAQLDLNEALKKRPGRKPGKKSGTGAANTG